MSVLSYFDLMLSFEFNQKLRTSKVKAQVMYYPVNHQESLLTSTFC